jgi:hypothetical protein
MRVLIVGDQLADGTVVDFVRLHVSRSVVCSIDVASGVAGVRSRIFVIKISTLALAAGVRCSGGFVRHCYGLKDFGIKVGSPTDAVNGSSPASQ